MAAVDLNADLGEGYGNWVAGDDEAMLDVVTSANIACGFHAGDPSTLRRVCAAAAERSVRIGAQVSFPDLAGFGRRHMVIPPAELTDIVLYQLGALDAFAQVAGTEVTYVKPHGALYHAAAGDPEVAAAVISAVISYDPSMAVLGPPGSALLAVSVERGLEAVAEGFADRAYLRDGSLMPRSETGAVLHDPAEVAARSVRMVTAQSVQADDGSTISLPIRSLCVHGDSPDAVTLARAVRSALDDAGVGVHPFT
jgi:UPF0271 protein